MSLNDLMQSQLNTEEAFVGVQDGQTVVVTNGRQFGVAFCGKDEQFNLFKGIRVAITKMLVVPAGEPEITLAKLLQEHNPLFAVIVDREELQTVIVDTAYNIGISEAKNNFLAVWRWTEYCSKDLNLEIRTLGGN